MHATSIRQFLRKGPSGFGIPASPGRGARWHKPAIRFKEQGVTKHSFILWRLGRIGIVIAAILLFFAAGLFVDWNYENWVIRRLAMEITANSATDSARILAAKNWVYHHGGFGKNSSYFILPALGPTALQVLEQGGDCSDKSRLTAEMLDDVGIEAGLVLMAPCFHCGFIHTVVEARYEGGRMVVDPTWNIDYPSDDGRYLGVRDLAGTNRGELRLTELQRERGAADKIAKMPATEAKFDYAIAMNWDKNIVTRAMAGIIRLIGYQPNTMFRPRFLEDPKLILLSLATVTGTFLMAASVILNMCYKRRYSTKDSN